MFCEAHDPSITANKPTMTQQAVACISTLSERKITIAPKTGIRLSRYYFTIVYNSSSAVRPTKQPAPINSIYRASDTFSEAAHARRGAADCGELRQTAGAHGKPLQCRFGARAPGRAPRASHEPSEAYLPEPAELQDEPTMNLSADPAPK
jgi:hypothetical protein